MSAPIEADVHRVSEGEVARPHNLLYGLNDKRPFRLLQNQCPA